MPEITEDKKSAKIRNRRVHMANERTFLAWIRTSIGVMAFGFVVEKFSLFIKRWLNKVFNQRVAELSYPMLANNVYDKETKKPIYKSYAVKEIGGLRIGLIGIASNIVDKTILAHSSVRFLRDHHPSPGLI